MTASWSMATNTYPSLVPHGRHVLSGAYFSFTPSLIIVLPTLKHSLTSPKFPSLARNTSTCISHYIKFESVSEYFLNESNSGFEKSKGVSSKENLQIKWCVVHLFNFQLIDLWLSHSQQPSFESFLAHISKHFKMALSPVPSPSFSRLCIFRRIYSTLTNQ